MVKKLKLTSFHITQPPYLSFHTPCSMWELLALAWRDGWWNSDRIKQQSCPLLKALITEKAEAAALSAAFIPTTLYFLFPARSITQHTFILHPLCSGHHTSFLTLTSPLCIPPLQEFWYEKNFPPHFFSPAESSLSPCPTYLAASTSHKEHAEVRLSALPFRDFTR